MSSKLARVLLLCDQVLLDLRQLSSKVVTLEQCYVGEGDNHAGTADLSDMEIALIQQEVDKIEQQNAQLQFRLDELERDFNASGNRFPSLEKSLRRCIRILRDMDSDVTSSSSSSSEGWLEPRPLRMHVQTLHVQIRALVRAVSRQNKRLQEFRDNLKSVQAALVKMVKKKQSGQPTGLEGYLPAKDTGEKLKAKS
ncbi:hypothetical protein ABBQ38_002952 [Trebouxia sp. C0009 RCD-2024]